MHRSYRCIAQKYVDEQRINHLVSFQVPGPCIVAIRQLVDIISEENSCFHTFFLGFQGKDCKKKLGFAETEFFLGFENRP